MNSEGVFLPCSLRKSQLVKQIRAVISRENIRIALNCFITAYLVLEQS